jgi:hypothetical protein
MRREQVGQDDAATLKEIAVALDKVGRQLDAADRMRGHSPWRAISDLETAIKGSANLLSDRFRGTHSALVERLLACDNLHL